MKTVTKNVSQYIRANNGHIPGTDELENEIKNASKIEDYLAKNKNNLVTQSLSAHLETLLSQKGIRKSDVVRGSLLDRTYVYQIFSGKKTPSRDKLIAIAFGMGLSYDETQKMLKLSGNRELYAKDERDAVIMFALHNKKNIYDLNSMLFERGLEALG